MMYQMVRKQPKIVISGIYKPPCQLNVYDKSNYVKAKLALLTKHSIADANTHS
jgi:hypothetical protein